MESLLPSENTERGYQDKNNTSGINGFAESDKKQNKKDNSIEYQGELGHECKCDCLFI